MKNFLSKLDEEMKEGVANAKEDKVIKQILLTLLLNSVYKIQLHKLVLSCYNEFMCFYNKCEGTYASALIYNSVSDDSGQKELKRMKAGIHPNYKAAKVILLLWKYF